jgi:endonuclease/exonuclease/phosphatase family metal-dependent hydrolase
VLKYREVFQSKLVAHTIFNRCQGLWESPADADILILQTELKAIDREVTKAALQAERSTATRTFGYAWSPTLAEVGQHVTFWRNCLRAAKHHQDPFSTLVPSQLQHHGIKHAGLNLSFYKSRLDDAWSHLSMAQDNARQLQKEFLASHLSNAEQDKEKTKVAKLKAILLAEYMKKLWPKLTKYAKGETRSGLD